MNIPLFFQREAGKCFKKEGILKKKKIHQKYPYFFRFGRYLKFGPLIYIIFLLLFFLQDSKIPWLRHSVPPAQDLPPRFSPENCIVFSAHSRRENILKFGVLY